MAAEACRPLDPAAKVSLSNTFHFLLAKKMRKSVKKERMTAAHKGPGLEAQAVIYCSCVFSLSLLCNKEKEKQEQEVFNLARPLPIKRKRAGEGTLLIFFSFFSIRKKRKEENILESHACVFIWK